MQHLAIIPDGNRRWAKKNKFKSLLGHKKGLQAFRLAIKFCIKRGIKFLSIYTFSLENFKRSEDEKNYLVELFVNEFPKQLPELIEQGIRVRFLGDRNYFPEKVRPVIDEIEEKTKHLDLLNFNLLFCYGAKGEIVHAVKNLAKKVKDGNLNINDINEQSISDSLWTTGIPDPDLIIRTSGIIRLSNFLLYQAAYSEFAFLECYWPEVTEAHLADCVNKFEEVQRNFGK
jgi:undecaprenyl diphosphate synthase